MAIPMNLRKQLKLEYEELLKHPLVIGEQNGPTPARDSDPPGSQYKPPGQAA